MYGHLLLVATTLSDVVSRCMNNSLRICKERISTVGIVTSYSYTEYDMK